MARAETIGRLHARPPEVSEKNLGTNVPTPVNEAHEALACSPPPVLRELPARSGFRRTGRQEKAGSYQLDANQIMSVLDGAEPLDRTADFQALMMRDRVQQFLAAHSRGAADHRLARG